MICEYEAKLPEMVALPYLLCSDTVMNPAIQIADEENFKPAIAGDNYQLKLYYRQGMKRKEEMYLTYEYVSSATGGLCRTCTGTYQMASGQTMLLCLDISL